MFTLDNTQGFNQAQLNIMNQALEQLIANGWDEKDASDHINNNWVDGANVDDLVK